MLFEFELIFCVLFLEQNCRTLDWCMTLSLCVCECWDLYRNLCDFIICLVLASSSSSSLMSSLPVVINNILQYAGMLGRKNCSKRGPMRWDLNYADPSSKKSTKKTTKATSTRAICFQISGLCHFTRDYKNCVCVCFVIRCFLVCDLIFRLTAVAAAATRTFVFLFAIHRNSIFLFHLGRCYGCVFFCVCLNSLFWADYAHSLKLYCLWRSAEYNVVGVVDVCVCVCTCLLKDKI